MKEMMATAFISMFCLCMYGQSEKYNSLCVFSGGDSVNVYLNSIIDSISYSDDEDDLYQNIWIGDIADKYKISTTDSVSFFNFYTSSIVTVDGDSLWDCFYTTPIGLFAYKSALPYNEESQAENIETLSYIDADWQRSCFILFDKESHMPVELLIDTITLYISYSNDSIYTLSIGIENELVFLGEFEYELSEIESQLESVNYESILKPLLYRFLAIVDVKKYDQLEILDILEKFKSLLSVEESSVLPEEQIKSKILILVRVFRNGERENKKGKGNILYSAVVTTNRCYDITSSSCTAEGTVYCAYSKFSEDCSYGILFDENPESLVIGSAEFEIPGHQETFANKFTVSVSGLKPTTKYYYRAYLKINSYDSSPLVIKYDNRDRNFTVGPNYKPKETYGDVKNFQTLNFNVITGGFSDITDKSASVECTYINVPEGGVCGVEISWNGGSTKQVSGGSDGTRTISLNGLKPNTTYTYCAYVEANGTIYYGENKTFTTDLPDISGTWTCTEEYYRFTGASPSYKTYSLTLNSDGSASCSEYESIVNGSWTFKSDGTVTVSLAIIATQTHNTGAEWSGTVDDIENPTKITGRTYGWNYNQYGYFQGDSHSVIMTK